MLTLLDLNFNGPIKEEKNCCSMTRNQDLIKIVLSSKIVTNLAN